MFMFLILKTKSFVWFQQENTNINMFGALFDCKGILLRVLIGVAIYDDGVVCGQMVKLKSMWSRVCCGWAGCQGKGWDSQVNMVRGGLSNVGLMGGRYGIGQESLTKVWLLAVDEY